MQINTRQFGIIDIDEGKIIDFPEGIPGFEEVKKFVLLSNGQDDSPFQWLQGVDNPDLCFVIIDPKVFRPEYIIDVDDSEVEVLDIKDTKDVFIYAIVVIPEDVQKMTANLKAPVLINGENNRGKQVILDKGDYQIKHYILEELQKMGGQK